MGSMGAGLPCGWGDGSEKNPTNGAMSGWWNEPGGAGWEGALDKANPAAHGFLLILLSRKSGPPARSFLSHNLKDRRTEPA